MLCLLCSCGSNRKKADVQEEEPVSADTIAVLADTMLVEECMEEEPALPAKADENFADFFYNFALDEKLQHSRIVFPLPCYTDSRKDTIGTDEWVYDPFFSRLECYTVLFDRVEDMNLEKDITSTSVKIEWFYLQANRTKRYYFERIRGEWMLEAVDDAATAAREQGQDEDFFDFYERFVADSTFQAERVAEPLHFVTIDPEDEFSVLQTTLEKGQWFAFQPVLPREFLTNVHYGQRLRTDSPSRIIELKGFGNGFCNILHFHRRGGKWKLVKYEDLGD